MPKLTPIKPKNLIKILEKQGFWEVRQKRSHKFFRHKDGRTTVILFHSGHEISRGLLRAILKDVNIDIEEFRKK